jgi:hypothetical protein
MSDSLLFGTLQHYGNTHDKQLDGSKMAKRGAEDQLTKDDVESGRGGRDDSDDVSAPRSSRQDML